MLSLIRADYTSHEREVILKYGVCKFLTFCARVYMCRDGICIHNLSAKYEEKRPDGNTFT